MFLVLVGIFPRIFMNHGVKWTHRYLIEHEPVHDSIVNVGKNCSTCSIKLAVVKLILENSLTYYVVKIHRYTFSHPKKTHSLIAHNWKCPGFIPIHWRNFKNINQKWGLKKIRVSQHQSFESFFLWFFVHCKCTISDILYGIPFINTFNF